MYKILIDMDNTLFDFDGSVENNMKAPPEMYKVGFFQNLKPLPGAIEAIARLRRSGMFDIYICTKPLADSPISYTEKVKSIAKHFPFLMGKIIMIQDKSMVNGDFLIDDCKDNCAAFHAVGGRSWVFKHNDSQTEWDLVVESLLELENNINVGGL